MTSTATTPVQSLRERALTAAGYRNVSAERQSLIRVASNLEAMGKTSDVKRALAEFTSVTDQVVSGDATAADLVAAARQLADARSMHLAIAEALNEVQSRLSSSVEEQHLAAESVDSGLAVCRQALAGIVQHVRDLAPLLVNATSTEEAMDAGEEALEAWKELRHLTKQYAEVRNVQQFLTVQVAASSDPTLNVAGLARIGQLADAIDVDTFWVEQRMMAARQSPRDTEPESDWAAWLVEPDAGASLTRGRSDSTSLMPDNMLEVFVLRCCTEATPWVPSTSQLRMALEFATIATAPTNGSGNTAHLETARRNYYNLTGVKPRSELREHKQRKVVSRYEPSAAVTSELVR